VSDCKEKDAGTCADAHESCEQTCTSLTNHMPDEREPATHLREDLERN
jgi:hypothetical protein